MDIHDIPTKHYKMAINSLELTNSELICILSLSQIEQKRKESHDVGGSLEFELKIGNLNSTTCLDTRFRINVISLQQLKRLDIQILRRRKIHTLKIIVGNSSKVVVNEEVLLRVKFSHFEANLWFFIFDHLPVQTLIGWPAMKRLKLGMDGNYILITEFLYGANVSIFDWFYFNLEEKRVFISKYGRKVWKKPWNQKNIWFFKVHKKLNVQLLKKCFFKYKLQRTI